MTAPKVERQSGNKARSTACGWLCIYDQSSAAAHLERHDDLEVAAVRALLHTLGVLHAHLAVDVGVLAGHLLVAAPQRAAVDLGKGSMLGVKTGAGDDAGESPVCSPC